MLFSKLKYSPNTVTARLGALRFFYIKVLKRNWSITETPYPRKVPGIHFRALLIGYFEGIDSERGIARRLADSLALRQLVRISLTESTPDHATISRPRRLIDVETHREVFGWVLWGCWRI